MKSTLLPVHKLVHRSLLSMYRINDCDRLIRLGCIKPLTHNLLMKQLLWNRFVIIWLIYLYADSLVYHKASYFIYYNHIITE